MKEGEFEKAYREARDRMDQKSKDQAGRLKEIHAYKKGLAEARAGLRKLGQKATPYLAKALGKADFHTGSILIEILSTIHDDPRADVDIVTWLDRRPFRRAFQGTQENFLKVLGRKTPTPEGLVPALERAMLRSHWQSRSAFLRALFGARNRKTVEPIAKALLRFLSKGDHTNNEVALNFLFYLLPDREVTPETKWEIIDTVTGMIWNPTYKNLALSATMALGRSGQEQAGKPLAELRDHRNGRVVLYAPRSLGMLGKKSRPVTREIVKFLKDKYPEPLRRETAEALARLRSEKAVWPLIDVLDEVDLPVVLQDSVRRALVQTCRKNLGASAQRWADWWENEQEDFEEDPPEKEEDEDGKKRK
jgi:hypothetical protein